MTKKDEIWTFLGAVLIGMLVLVSLLRLIPVGALYEYHAAIDKCEKDLPRNQRCEISAIIKVKNGK